MDARTIEEINQTINESTSKNFNNFSTNDRTLFVENLRTGFYDNSFKAFFPTVDTIYFEGNNLAELNRNDIEKFSSLIESSNIRKLFLGDNNLGLLTAEKIKALIPGLKNLDELHLNNNYLCGIGTDNFKILLDRIKETNIKYLDLSNNLLLSLGLEGIFILREVVKNRCIQTLDISNNKLDIFFLKNMYESMLKHAAEELAIGKKEVESKLQEAGRLSLVIESAKVMISEFELNLVRGPVRQFNPHPTFLEKISEKFTEGIGNLKRFYSLYKINSFAKTPHPIKKEVKLIVEPAIQDLQKDLAKNRLRHAGNYSLKELCIFTIYNRNIKWNAASLPIDLKEEIANNSCGLK